MNQRSEGGGGRRQERQPTENEQISNQSRAQTLLNQLMRDIQAKRRDIEAVLPADIKFEKFQACLNMAIRREPKLLECHGPSLIRAAIMSAYDGLLPDGKEAVIVYRAMSFKLENGSWSPKKRLEASYMPMAFGLRKKIIAAGAAKHLKAVTVRKNDEFDWEEGLNARLVHRPLLGTDAERGELVAVYSIATLPDGEREFEVMTRDQVMKVKAKAQTKDVWNEWEEEMWRKSVIRRHSKALPTSTPIRDAEAQVMFPDFAGGQAALPAAGAQRPTREQFAALGAPEVELPLDLSGFGGDGVLHEEERAEPEQQRRPRAKKAETGEESKGGNKDHGDTGVQGSGEAAGAGAADSQGGGPAAAESAAASEEEAPLETPKDDAGWDRWQAAILAEIGRCKDPERLVTIQRREQANTAAAPKRIRDRVEGSFTDMRVDLMERGSDDV